ncbi:SAM-dependent methyltransferase [Patescibacteria group bacterium]|nr:SAM-dependent methyltransferase [Patescibacteria group bacterium]
MIRTIVPSSYRDPSGFVFLKDGVLFRQINEHYKDNYELLMGSGLYQALVDDRLLIPHEEVSAPIGFSDHAYKIIKPEPIPFISYSYEWCFSQLKDAARITLTIQKKALDFGMSLKDANAFNIQFLRGKPILIDTLSFETYRRGRPWVAYRQFCEQFLAPLALVSLTDGRLQRLSRLYPDGVPLDLTSALLPLKARFTPRLLTHLFLHAKSQIWFADKAVSRTRRGMNQRALVGLIESLRAAVEGLTWHPSSTQWIQYGQDSGYSTAAELHKKRLVKEFLGTRKRRLIWDLGANVGIFSRLAGKTSDLIVAIDGDPVSVEEHYLNSREEGETNILPLVIDLTNPSPGIGWEGEEWLSLIERGPADVVLALALVHHLAISHNVPLHYLARFFRRVTAELIIEFVPKEDLQVKKMLSRRDDIFPHYSEETFESEFKKYFRIRRRAEIRGSKRMMYLMQKK